VDLDESRVCKYCLCEQVNSAIRWGYSPCGFGVIACFTGLLCGTVIEARAANRNLKTLLNVKSCLGIVNRNFVVLCNYHSR
jgi:hypothetical protein